VKGKRRGRMREAKKQLDEEGGTLAHVKEP